MRPPVGQPFFLEDPPGVETAMVSKPAGATEDLVFTALGFRISRLLRFCALAIINSCEYWIVIRAHDMLGAGRSEEHTSELQTLMRTSYAVFCLKKLTIKPYIVNTV